MKKRMIILVAMVITMVALVACGGGKAETTTEKESGKTEVAKENKSSKKKTVPEDEIVVRVGDVEIPIVSTWTELATIAYENGWDIDSSLYPDEEAKKFTKKGTIDTPQGEVHVSLMANKDKTEAEVEYIALSPFSMESGDVSVLGIKTDTSLKKIGEIFELIEVYDDKYYYKVDEYVTLQISLDYYEDKNAVNIIRTKHFKRGE